MRNKDLSWHNFPGGTEINAEERGTSISCLFGERRSCSPPGTLGSCQEPAAVQPGARPRGWEPAHPWGSIPEHPAQEAQRFPLLTCQSGGVPLTALHRPSALAVPVRPCSAAALCSPGGETASRGSSVLLLCLALKETCPPPKACHRTLLSSSPAQHQVPGVGNRNYARSHLATALGTVPGCTGMCRERGVWNRGGGLF